MTHCCGEPLQENTRCFSSQVAGDSTAHTVTIRSIGFMPRILPLIHRINNTISYVTGNAKFHYTVKIRNFANAFLVLQL